MIKSKYRLIILENDNPIYVSNVNATLKDVFFSIKKYDQMSIDNKNITYIIEKW